jgi:putative ABC transport system permease protein
MQPVLNDECPQLEKMRRDERLSIEERRAAADDPRCDRRLIFWGDSSLVDDGTALAALTGATGEDLARAQATLRAGGVVVRSPLLIKDGLVTMSVFLPSADGSTSDPQPTKGPVPPGTSSTTMTFPGYELTTSVGPGTTIVSPGAVSKAGLSSVVTTLVAATTEMPTQAQEEKAAAALQAQQGFLQIERGFPNEIDPRLWILIGAAITITLGAAAVGTGLAAADGRADLSTLAAVGASPTVRRGLSISQSGVIAGLGSVLGALAGIGAAVAIITALNRNTDALWPEAGGLPIVLPWLTLLMTLVITPLVAILGAGLFTRSRLPIERRL